MTLKSKNPSTGATLAEYERMSPTRVDAAIEAAATTQDAWSRRPYEARADVLRAVAERLRSERSGLAKLMAEEMGKPLAEGEGEVDKCAWVCEYYAEHAQAFLAPRQVESDASRSCVVFRPLGVILAVMPWNFPLWQVFRFAAPTLMAGNTALLKHASNVTGASVAIQSLFDDVRAPSGLFTSLLIDSDGVGRVLEHPAVAAATLTGSTPAGRAVASTAGEQIKKVVLELGGSDPYVVLADADVEHAAEVCARSRLINNGQSCISAKRFIVERSVYDEFIDRFTSAMQARTYGDPLQEATELGPMARLDLRDDLHQQVRRSVEAGATLRCGGEVPRGEGAYYPPTVLCDVAPGMPAYEEELFGPVAAVIAADDEDDAIRIANDSAFGLGAAVFTEDVERGYRIAADRLRAGCCFVNAHVRSDPRLPFGGIKQSGFGRELGEFGIHEFVNAKTVYVR